MPIPAVGTPKQKKAHARLMSQAQVEKLNRNIQTMNFFINHGYLSTLSACEPEVQSYLDFSGIELFRLTRMVRTEGEDYFEKLISLYTAMYYKNGSVGMIINSDGKTTELFLCISVNDSGASAEQLSALLRSSFPGTTVVREAKTLRDRVLGRICATPTVACTSNRYVASISVVPSRRTREVENNNLKMSAQGIEKLIDSMQGKSYTALILADPISAEQIESRRMGFETMFTLLSPFAKETVSYGENESDATNYSLSSNFSENISDSISKGFGTSHSVNHSSGRGGSRNSSSGGQGILGGSYNWGSGSCWNTSEGVSNGTSTNSSESHSVSTGNGTGTSQGDSHTEGRNISINLVREIKSVQQAMERLDAEIKRLNANRAFGMWDCCCYVVSGEEAVTGMAASNLIALLSGDEAYGGVGYINHWNYNANPRIAQALLDSVAHLQHPCFDYRQAEISQMVSPAMMVSGRDLPVMLSLPMRSVMGTEVLTKAAFGRNVPETFRPKRPFRFGNVVHMGALEPTQLQFDLDAFASHCFICGAAGSGKSNTTYQLLNEFYQSNVKFLVVEPAKGEYKLEFAGMPDMNVFTCTRDRFRMLYLNPFEFNSDFTNIKEHMDRLNGILQTCWPMFGPLPGMIKDAIEEAYISCGWDLKRSRQIRKTGHRFPTFADMLDAVEKIISESPYPESTRGEYRGALGMRIRSLMTGFEETIFSQTQGLTDEELFEHNAIVDLSSLGNAESRSLIMGILITRLREYRMNTQTSTNSALKHVTVLEEAHNILKRCNQEQSMDSSNVQGAAVGMLTDSIAEMRSSGEGFLIIDQSPSAVDEAAIKNTAVKIVMRLPEEKDCKAMGAALSLQEDQIRELSKLEVGVAALFHAGWSETILGKMGQVWKNLPQAIRWKIQPKENNPLNEKRARSAVAQWVVSKLAEKELSTLNEAGLLTYTRWLRTFRDFELNENAWKDMEQETRQFIAGLRSCGITNNSETHSQLVITRLFGGFLRSFFQMDDLFRLCPLQIPDYEPIKFDVMHVLTNEQVSAIKAWWDELRPYLVEYIQFPLHFEGMIPESKRNSPSFGADVMQADYMRTAMLCVLRSLDDQWQRQKHSYQYFDAWFELRNKLEED